MIYSDVPAFGMIIPPTGSSLASISPASFRIADRHSVNIDDHGYVIGGLLPAPHLAQNLGGFQARLQRRCRPDMIQPPAAIILLPIRRAVAPPGKQLFRLRREMTDGILPLPGLLHCRQLFDLDRRM